MSVIKMAFKDRLKKLRGDKGITQEELARVLDVPASTIRRLESAGHGYPQKERMEKIANYFNCSVDYLLERTDDKQRRLLDEKSEFIKIIELSEVAAIEKIKESFSFNGRNLSDDQARAIYYFSLGQVNK